MSACLFLFPFWAAAPKGTKSCRTQGDFRSSVCAYIRSFVRPPQALSGLKSALSGLKFTLSDLKYAFSGLESALSGLKSALSGIESALSGLNFALSGLKSALSGPLRPYVSPPSLRGQILGLRG